MGAHRLEYQRRMNRAVDYIARISDDLSPG
jgi:hypothetical protein